MMSDRMKKKARATAAGVKSARRHAVAAALPRSSLQRAACARCRRQPSSTPTFHFQGSGSGCGRAEYPLDFRGPGGPSWAVGVPCQPWPEAVAISAGNKQAANDYMNYLLIRHKVKDFKRWKAGYDAHGPAREGAALKERCLLRNNKSRNEVFILFEAGDLARAKAFCASADLRAAMKKAGVTGKPELSILADA